MAEEIKDIISTILSGQNDWKIKLIQNWPEIIGQLKSKVVLEKINTDSLVIGVYDSCWLQELYLLSPILLKKINKKLETQRFKRLRFKQVDVKNYKKFEKAKPNDYKKIVITLTKKEELALEKIKDSDLSIALRNFLVRCHTQESQARESQTRELQTRGFKTPAPQTREFASKSIKLDDLKRREF